jgi:tetratricopeptide (TPR) repeat protein
MTMKHTMNMTGKRTEKRTVKRSLTLAGVAAAALLVACSGRPLVPVPVAAAGAEAYYALGRAEHAARRPAAARDAWNKALRLDPAHADSRNGLAVLLAEQGAYAQAIALWRPLVEQDSSRPAAEQALLSGNLGYAMYLDGQHEAALAMLEKACLLDPYQPQAWERLAGVLAQLGQADRAGRMAQQAASLRQHDIRADYGRGGSGSSVRPLTQIADSPPPAAQGTGTLPAGLARTEIRQVGAMLELHRIAPVNADRNVVAVAGAGNAIAPTAPVAMPGKTGLRLEISNGNGVRGMAAAWARQLQGPQWQSVRLTNARPYAVPATSIEYRAGAHTATVAHALAQRLGLPAPRPLDDGVSGADLRIVLGQDRDNVRINARAGRTAVQGTLGAP